MIREWAFRIGISQIYIIQPIIAGRIRESRAWASRGPSRQAMSVVGGNHSQSIAALLDPDRIIMLRHGHAADMVSPIIFQ
ncbi:hypothetical protein [Burkholderia sp. Nafp2/4-1b]|uniref:hypothetical protein n=1 Tax=Burkholderia sp. Nafp2/4-1b TaxID=2116686 RepID=UPI0013CE46A5|nr:hypothetical protein [Burkholderia sp. Nafp2/4-1b]